MFFESSERTSLGAPNATALVSAERIMVNFLGGLHCRDVTLSTGAQK